MKIAILSDIHSNSIALKAVLKEVHARGVDQLLIAGDFAGYYYHPDLMFKYLSSWSWQGVVGNHDTILKKIMQRDIKARESYRRLYGHSLEIALDVLTPDQLALLHSLAEKQEFVIDDNSILLCHGSPWDPDEYIYPDASDSVWRRVASLGYNAVIMGHTHYPLIKRVANTLIINPGSVGQPRDKGSMASWVLFDSVTSESQINRVYFDPTAIISEAQQYDAELPYLVTVLTRKQSRYV